MRFFWLAMALYGDFSNTCRNASFASRMRPSSVSAFPRRLWASRSSGNSPMIDRFADTASDQRLCMARATAFLAVAFLSFCLCSA